MNIYVVTSGEVPFRTYAFPNSEGKAAQLLLAVMRRNGRPATIAAVQAQAVAAALAAGQCVVPDGWDVIVAQQAL